MKKKSFNVDEKYMFPDLRTRTSFWNAPLGTHNELSSMTMMTYNLLMGESSTEKLRLRGLEFESLIL